MTVTCGESPRSTRSTADTVLRPAYLLVVVAVAAACAVHAVRPAAVLFDGSYLLIILGSAAAAWVGARRTPKHWRLVPTLIAAGLTTYAIGDVIWYLYLWNGVEFNTSPADVFYLSCYLGFCSAIWFIVVRTRGHADDADAVIDAVTIVTVSLLVFWNLSIEAIVSDPTATGFERSVWAAYPILDAILLAMVVRVLMRRDSSSALGPYFGIGVACWLAADIGFMMFTFEGPVEVWTDVGWMLGAAFMAVSTWRKPPAVTGPQEPRDAARGGGVGKLAVAIGPLLVPPALHLKDDLTGATGNEYELFVGMTVLLVLAFLRTARLLRSESRAREELGASRDAALAGSHAKSSFLATMSHEIRTPMNGVIGLTGLLLTTDLDSRQRQYAEGVRGAGDALLTIINDILDFSKVEAGKLDLEAIDFNLEQVVEDVAELVAEPAQGKGLELLAYCSPEVPLGLRGDPSRLRQVLLNLASNACKFTDRGEVVIGATLHSRSSDGVVVRFEVRDTGMGIDEDYRERLFDPFSQADSSTTRKFGGTGLGLAICHQLVTAMGGTMDVESSPGRGSTFWFNLPLGFAVDDATTPNRSSDLLPGQRVLVVDDNETNRLILSEQLGAWGMQVDVVANGPAALLQLDHTEYDLAILDLCMPDMDGLQLARIISRSSTSPGLVLLTSRPDVDPRQAEEAGFAASLTKPVHLSRLQATLQDVVDSSRQPAPVVPIAAPTDQGRAHVLVVEDDETSQLVAVGVLEHLGYTITVAADGREALAALERSTFDVVLMDCQMPVMDGYAAATELRRIEGLSRRTPIVAMTAGVVEGERERCLAAGMDDYVSKPVSPKALDLAISRWLPAASA